MLRQRLEQKQLQRLSPQQIQLMKLLQVPTVAFEQRIKQEMEDNPALEDSPDEKDEFGEDENVDADNSDSTTDDEFDISDYLDDDDLPAYKYQANNSSKDDEEKNIPFISGNTFHDALRRQLRMRNISQRQEDIAIFLVGNLDDAGYLRREIEALVDDFAFTQGITTNEKEIEEALEVIQSLDPAGVGARNLRECLLIQLRNRDLDEKVTKLAHDIVESSFESFIKKHYSKIVKKHDISDEELREAIEIITKLNPKPGNSLSDSTKINETVVPDFTVTNENGELQLSLNGRNAPDLYISSKYKEMLETYGENKDNITKKDKEAVLFIKQKIDSAKWFVDAVKQRQHTLMKTMSAIMNFQREYFLEGDETLLKPMILKDIAEIVEMDISTISRVVNSKYVMTPFGVFLLKTFFSESIQKEDGEEVSTREVKRILMDAIDAEDKSKPLTDEKLSALLKEKGYKIARRTIAKYREQLNIPVARLRKVL